ncbi:MAG TPA: hypothetical protein VFX16_19015 [Pseudonocardiaceae bacterium]|nr:hypothetical protein [Pseudonocardiaceae bacterium]
MSKLVRWWFVRIEAVPEPVVAVDVGERVGDVPRDHEQAVRVRFLKQRFSGLLLCGARKRDAGG